MCIRDRPDTASSTSSVSAGFDTRVFVEPELELVSSTSSVSAEFDTFVFVELDPVAAGAVTTVSVDFNTYWQPVDIVATSDVYVSFEFNTGFCDLEYAESASFTGSQLQFSVLEANFTASVSSTVSTYADFDVELSVEYPLIPEDPTSTTVVTASFYVWKNQALSTLYSCLLYTSIWDDQRQDQAVDPRLARPRAGHDVAAEIQPGRPHRAGPVRHSDARAAERRSG